jgi:arginyl-tRNA synthetase
MGETWVNRCEHVPTGLYRFKDAKMSTRKGNFITLENVLAEAKERVTHLMRERVKTQPHQELPVDLEGIAEAIAIGAVVFHDLHTDPARDVEFDLERVVDFEGETGPYLQYAHTRCLSILRKAKDSGQMASTLSAGNAQVVYEDRLVEHLQSEVELQLVKTLGQFPLHLERTLTFSKASQLAHYLIDVTRAFGTFYRECQVLGNTPELTQARLMLVDATRRILGQGLSLLGIPLPERM